MSGGSLIAGRVRRRVCRHLIQSVASACITQPAVEAVHLATIDLLVVRPHDHDGDNPVAWDQQATDLTTATHHWSGNPTHLQLREPTETGAVDSHDTAADWWLLPAPPWRVSPPTPGTAHGAAAPARRPRTNGPQAGEGGCCRRDPVDLRISADSNANVSSPRSGPGPGRPESQDPQQDGPRGASRDGRGRPATRGPAVSDAARPVVLARTVRRALDIGPRPPRRGFQPLPSPHARRATAHRDSGHPTVSGEGAPAAVDQAQEATLQLRTSRSRRT